MRMVVEQPGIVSTLFGRPFARVQTVERESSKLKVLFHALNHIILLSSNNTSIMKALYATL